MAEPAEGTPDFDEISSREKMLPNSIRHARVFSDQTFDFRGSIIDTLTKLGPDTLDSGEPGPDKVGLSDGNNIAVVDLTLMGLIQGLNNLQHSHRGQLLASSHRGPHEALARLSAARG
ncbi:hypothetical protein PG994_004478 [Apiospora phragmitis]|uniref:Uncharacterized protein n=1 Tax=Apiospora phragmitis TaxID=2905665 RepID=A0ABR1VUK1_9PEZI